jgi:hypothetical protein
MLNPLRYSIIAILTFLSLTVLSETKPLPESIHLASTSWCPYVCDDLNQPGFIVEYMTELLSMSGIQLKVDIFPWSRSILLARKGQYDGVLTAAESETPDFYLTESPSGKYQDCLYRKIGRDISYLDRSSFQNLTLGGIKNYGYNEPMNSLISNPQKGEKAYLISHGSPLRSLIQMTNKNRIDLFVSDRAVLDHFIKLNPDQLLVEVAGCTEEKSFFTAISPNNPHKELWLNLLNEQLGSSKSKALYLEAKRRYSN